ncbi:MAG TPA: alkaline phosphatase family protein [Steroidobacteraceae bacterium]|nr:alkaline phosphatase family protein [Steroidobacteraceae bacterium]
MLLITGPALASGRHGHGPVGHVFLIVLENQSFEATFGPGSRAPYLARTLTREGLLLRQYYAIGHNSLDNYIALVSGQAPNEDTQNDCWRYIEFKLAEPRLDAHGQALGRGCVYPGLVKTLPDELEAQHLSWKGYMEDMGKDPTRESRTCARPPLGSVGSLQLATPTDQYAVKHNPFVYFHSIIDTVARCNAHVVALDELPRDLASARTTPSYVFITPNLCHDGHDAPCADGEPGGPVSTDAFLRKWVPLLTHSEAFQRDGLLIVTFDESSFEGPEMAAACCDERPLPGARLPPGIGGPGGGRIGAVLLSPFLPRGVVSDVPYNHYALLRSIERIFGVKPLGYAADPRLRTLDADFLSSAAVRRPGW